MWAFLWAFFNPWNSSLIKKCFTFILRFTYQLFPGLSTRDTQLLAFFDYEVQLEALWELVTSWCSFIQLWVNNVVGQWKYENSALDVLQPLEVESNTSLFMCWNYEIIHFDQQADQWSPDQCQTIKKNASTRSQHYLTFLCVYVAVLFLEQWKRRQISLSFSWDLTGIEEDEVYAVYMYTHRHTHTRILTH